MGRNEDVRFISASIKIPPLPKYHPFLQLSALPFAHHGFFFHIQRAKESIHRLATSLTRAWGRSHILCSSSLALTRPDQEHNPWRPQHGKEDAERVLISEVLIRNKDGEVLERADIEAAAAGALRFSRPNSALTVREVQEDVHRIIDSGVFCSCMPVAVDTRDGIRLVFQRQRSRRMHGLAHHSINMNLRDRNLQFASLITDDPTFSVDDASISDTLSISGFTTELTYFSSDKRSGYLEVKNSYSSMSKEVYDGMPTTDAETIQKVDCIFNNDNKATSSDDVIQTSLHQQNDPFSSSDICDEKSEMVKSVSQMLCHDIPVNGLNPKTAELRCSLSSRNDLTNVLGTQGEHISRSLMWDETATDSLGAGVKTVFSLSSSLSKEMATGNPEIRDKNVSSTYSAALNEKAAIIESANSKFPDRIINYRSPDSDLLFETLETSNHLSEVDDIEMHDKENVLVGTIKMAAPSTDKGQISELKIQLDMHMDSINPLNSGVQTNIGCHTGQEVILLPHLNYNGMECEINKSLAATTPSLDGVESGIAHKPCTSLKNSCSLQVIFDHLQASGPAESESNLLYSVENAISESTAYDSTKKNDSERIYGAPCLGVIGPITQDVVIDEIPPQDSSSQDGFGGNSSKTISEKEVLCEHRTKQEMDSTADPNCLGTEFQCGMKIAATKLDCSDSETHLVPCSSAFCPGVIIPSTHALAIDDVMSEESLSQDYFGGTSAKAASARETFYQHQTKQETELTDDSNCQGNECRSSLKEVIAASNMDDSDSETRVASFDRDPCAGFIIPNMQAVITTGIPPDESLSRDYFDDASAKTACEKEVLSEHQTKQGTELMSNSNFHGTEYEISLKKVIAASKVDGPNSEKHAVSCGSSDAYASISCGLIISNSVDNISSSTLSSDVISSGSPINVSSPRDDSEDPHGNISVQLTNKSVIISSNVTSATTVVSQGFPVDSFRKSSINIWTNGGLLGLEPSKPPDISVPNSYSSDDIYDERSASKSPPRISGSGNESRKLLSEADKLNIISLPELDNIIGKIYDDQSDSLLSNQRPKGSIGASSFCKIEKAQTACFSGTGSEVVGVQGKGSTFFSETDRFAKKDLESTVSRLNGIGISVGFSSLAHRFLLSNLQRKSPMTGIASLSELMNNDVHKLHGINIHSKDKERPKLAISSAPSHKLSKKEDSVHGFSEKPVSPGFDSSGCQSPPLEHMKVSFQPMNDSDVSKLNLEFFSSEQQGNLGNAVFPSFQLITESFQPLLDGVLESDDDTFCRSCPYSSDDLLSLLSESDAEIWGQEEIDISYRIKTTGSISNSIEFNDLDACGVSQVNDVENLKHRNDEQSFTSGDNIDIPNISFLQISRR